MTDGTSESQSALTKGARITGDQRSSLGTSFGQRYAGGESIRSIAQDTGRSYGFVHGVLKESGAALRGRGGATRGPRRVAAPEAGADDTQLLAEAPAPPASAVRTKAKAKAEKDNPAGKLVDKVVDKVTEKAGKAKSAKDDKGKKKAEPKKSSKKSKKA